MSGTSQLSLFNKALRHLEERKLASLTENREPLRYLNDEYDDAILFCLHAGLWNHAIRDIMVSADTNLIPQFGFQYAFRKPGDWVRTLAIADNEQMEPLIRRLYDQNQFWYSDITPLYVRYVSSDPDYGRNLSIWPPAFVEYVGCYLAWTCAPRLKQSQEKVDAIEKKLKRSKADALARDAQDLPPGKPPYGTWVQSRAPRGSILPYGTPFAGLED